MTRKVIQVPTINDSREDFARLFEMCEEVGGGSQDLCFDFSGCSFLRSNAVALIGGLARWVESRNGSVSFDWSTLRNQWVKTTLRQNGFANAFGDESVPWEGTSIPYREDRTFQPDKIAEYLADSWLGRGWVNVSESLKNAIVERVLELYVNAFEHAASRIGVFSCGQYFPQKKELYLTLVDFGVGIPANVRAYYKHVRPDLPAERLNAGGCLKWAFQSMATTKQDSTSRGMGLDLFKSFIRVNRGKMLVFSNDGCAELTTNRDDYCSFSPAFTGTVFHIQLTCDEAHYRLAGRPPRG